MEMTIKDGQLELLLQADLVASRISELVAKTNDFIHIPEEYYIITLNMSAVKNIDSKGVTFVVGLYKTAENNSKEFKAIGLSEDVYGLFQLMKLNKIFQIELAWERGGFNASKPRVY